MKTKIKILVLLMLILNIRLMHSQEFGNFSNIENFFSLPKEEVENKLKQFGYQFKSKDNSGNSSYLKENSTNTFEVNTVFKGNDLTYFSWNDTLIRGQFIVRDIGYDSSYVVDESKTNDYTGVYTTVSKEKGFQTVIFKTEFNIKKAMIGFSLTKVANESLKATLDNFFLGTKVFCDETNDWKYAVSINDNKIKIVSYPGSNNSYYKNKSKPLEIVNGIIKNGKIVTKDAPEYLTNRFSYANGVFSEVNNEGGFNNYVKCLK